MTGDNTARTVSSEMANKYWDLANNITGFAIVQGIALMITAAHEKPLATAIRDHKYITITSFLVGSIVYSVIVKGCFEQERKLDPVHGQFKSTMYARLALLVLSTICGIVWVAFM
ncbi:MAG: hypothetical protein CV089_03240 [Nitrospira sp. WS110]|nr:hypothetical protein [Nitrospira sp. WS110]